MPMPLPRADESEQEYVSRFMGNDDMVAEFPDEKQRSAVAYKTYRDEDELCDDCEDESDKSGIPAVSILTIGEAKGHDLYVDDVSLEKALILMKSAPNGVKVKLNHGSGLENVVGFARNPRITDDKLIADLHLLKSSPHYGLIKEMASEAPDQFGVSLAFYNETEEIDGKEFIRPISVKSADLVGEPAANASLFEAITQFSMKTAKALGIELAGDCGQNEDGTFGSNNTCAGNKGSGSDNDSRPRYEAGSKEERKASRDTKKQRDVRSDIEDEIDRATDILNESPATLKDYQESKKTGDLINRLRATMGFIATDEDFYDDTSSQLDDIKETADKYIKSDRPAVKKMGKALDELYERSATMIEDYAIKGKEFSMKQTNFVGSCGQEDDGTFGPNNTCASGGSGNNSEESSGDKPSKEVSSKIKSEYQKLRNTPTEDLRAEVADLPDMDVFPNEHTKRDLIDELLIYKYGLKDVSNSLEPKTKKRYKNPIRTTSKEDLQEVEFAGTCGQEDDGTFGSGNDCAVGHGRPSKGDSDPRDKSRPLPPPTKENTSYKKGAPVTSAGPSDPAKNERIPDGLRRSMVKARQQISEATSGISKVNPKLTDRGGTGSRSIQADNIKGVIADFKSQTAGHKYGPTTDRQKEYYRQVSGMLRNSAKEIYGSGREERNSPWNDLSYRANEVADAIDKMIKGRSILEEGMNQVGKLLEFRCWEGYEPVAGKAPYSKGSCKPVEAESPFDKEKNTMNEDYKKVMEALSALEKRLASLEEGKAPMDEEKDKKDEAMAEAPKIVIEKEDEKEEEVAEMSAVIKKVLTEFGIKPVPASPATEAKKGEVKNFEALVKSHPEYANSKLKAIRAVMLSHPSEYREATMRGITTI